MLIQHSLTYRFLLPLSILLLLTACDSTSTQPSETLAEAQDDTPLEHALKHTQKHYVCPMHPQIIRDEPGTCPICGMDLVLKKQTPAKAEPTVTVSGALQQTMNLRTAHVKRGVLWKYIKTVGTIQYNEHQIVQIHPRASGWVEQLQVRAEGESVKQGDTLLALYSPDILNAQVDFLIALRQAGHGMLSENTLEKARNRLRLLAVPEAIITDLKRTGKSLNTVPILAPQSGVIGRLNIREGAYVTPATEILMIADLSTIWVLIDVFESQLAWVEKGKAAEIRVPAYPGKVWEGEVDYLYPSLDPKTRTLQVRLQFKNPDHLLKPNMFARVVIYGGPKRDTLIMPAAALIATGERQVVMVRTGAGKFKPVPVKTGMRQGDRIEILAGLKQDDEIVISGQFLLDSEANIQASFIRAEQDNAP